MNKWTNKLSDFFQKVTQQGQKSNVLNLNSILDLFTSSSGWAQPTLKWIFGYQNKLGTVPDLSNIKNLIRDVEKMELMKSSYYPDTRTIQCGWFDF